MCGLHIVRDCVTAQRLLHRNVNNHDVAGHVRNGLPEATSQHTVKVTGIAREGATQKADGAQCKMRRGEPNNLKSSRVN